jgi:glycosyltransferase involved in cell wall biosynthesis
MTLAYSIAETMHPDIAVISDRRSEDARAARSRLGLADLPTIAATGPFDDLTHAHHLAAAFTILQRACRAQLVLLGTGAHRTAALRAVPSGAATRVHLLDASPEPLWSDIIGAADVVVLSASSGPRTLLDVLAAGRAVVAPMDPTTVPLVVPTSAGLVYRPDDVSALAAAIKRLMTTPSLRQGMASRAREVARRYQLDRVRCHEAPERKRT